MTTDDLFNAMIKSIADKASGRGIARIQMGIECATCAKTFEPDDIGVDPETNQRVWLAKCCGDVHTYVEQLN